MAASPPAVGNGSEDGVAVGTVRLKSFLDI
jgi:hypothetical protein